jgi:putative IMPACT (imprinted ancient) family translation regulator
MYSDDQFSLILDEGFTLGTPEESFHDVIIDRKSHYTVTGYRVMSREDVDIAMKKLLKEKYFQKATHNSYAFRIMTPEGMVLEGKNDDGETGAGMCILRELQRKDARNLLLIVTRYFWGVHLQTDRFKNVIDSCKIFFERVMWK